MEPRIKKCEISVLRTKVWFDDGTSKVIFRGHIPCGADNFLGLTEQEAKWITTAFAMSPAPSH